MLLVIVMYFNVKVLLNVMCNLLDEEIDCIGEIGGVIYIVVFSVYLVDLLDFDL